MKCPHSKERDLWNMHWLVEKNLTLEVSYVNQTCHETLLSRKEYFCFNLFVCFLGIFVPLKNFFTHLETSPLPVKGCKFRPMLGTYGHWAVRVLWCTTPTVTRGIYRIYNGHLWGPMTHLMPSVLLWSCHYLLTA